MDPHWRTIRDFVRVGSTGKPRGITGEIKIFLNDAYAEDTLNAEFLFLDHDGSKVPLQVESIREIQDIVIKFKGVDDPSAASTWTSLDIYLPIDEVEEWAEDDQETSGYGKLTGYEISDKRTGVIGNILEIIEFPQQEMAKVIYQGKEVLIPLNPVFIDKVDTRHKVMIMDLPEGLLEI